MNIRQLTYFAAAVEHRSVTRAAERLHIAQPALGQHIRALEAELEVALLERHSRGVTPTAAGELLYARAREIFDLLARTQQEVAALGKVAARVTTLGLTPSLTLLIGTDLQLAYRDQAPGAHLRVWEDPSFRLAEAVENGELDVALAYDIAPRPSLDLVPVMEEEMLFACRPDAAPAGPAVDLPYILAHDIALGTVKDVGRRAVAHAAGFSPENLQVRYELQSIAGIREMVLRGNAVSVLPFGSIAHEIEAGRLVGMRIAGGPVKSTMHIVRRTARTARDAAEADLHAWLVEQAVTMAVERQPLLARRLA
jgi:LysR family nitrogen assimilation transcriptional regulator